MITQLLPADAPEALARASALLRQGELVVFPTDTVYGVGVDAFNPAAVDRLYRVKQRDLEKGIPILISDLTILPQVTAGLPERHRAALQALITRYWPGPLTLILPRRLDLPANLSPNAGVAVRLPNHDAVRRLIRAAGGAVAASSANLSGEPPACTAEEAVAIFQGRVAAVVDGGRSPGGAPSTILDFTGAQPELLRAGPLPMAQLLADMRQLA